LKRVRGGCLEVKLVGEVVSLFISKESGREEHNSLNTDINGVVGDKFNGKDINRSVLLTSLKSYNMAKDRGIKIEYGDLGENILVDFNPYELPIDSKIKIGDATFRLVQNCTLCKSLSKIDSKLPKLLKSDRGVFIQVIKPAKILKGDKVFLL